MSIQSSDGLFTIRTSSSTGTYTIHNTIPTQTLVLKSVRVQFTSAAEALTAGVIYFDAPWLNSNHLVDGLSNLYTLPIPLDNQICTIYTCDIPVAMSKDILESFTYRIITSSGVAPTGFSNICLQFSYSNSLS